MFRHFLLLILLVACGITLLILGSSLPQKPVAGISNASLNMQFIRGPNQATLLLGSPETQSGLRNWTTMRRQQFLDFVFIPLYWAFFFYTLASPVCHSASKAVRLLGWTTRGCISIAAIADICENITILCALSASCSDDLWPFWFAIVKWTFLFLTLALQALPLILRPGAFWPNAEPELKTWLLRMTGVIFLTASIFGCAGIAGQTRNNGIFLVYGSTLMMFGFLPLLVTLWSATRASGRKGKGDQEERLTQQSADNQAKAFKEVLAHELEEIDRAGRLRDKNLKTASSGPKAMFPYREHVKIKEADVIPAPAEIDHVNAIKVANERGLLGLALSGGGIRSATFNLGVLQGLAELKFLRRIHYLSTVSGGGYIGCWLTAWIQRRGMHEVETRLAASRSQQPYCREPAEIRFLREYSNYLTPRTGLLGADTWTGIAIYLRNLLLNQMILVLFLAGILLAPWVLVAVAQEFGPRFAERYSLPWMALFVAAIPAVYIALRNMWFYTIEPLSGRVLARVKNESYSEQISVEWLWPAPDQRADWERFQNSLPPVEIWDRSIALRNNAPGGTRIVSVNREMLELAEKVSVNEGDLVIAVYSKAARQPYVSLLTAGPAILAAVLLSFMLAKSKLLAGYLDSSRSMLIPWMLGGSLISGIFWWLSLFVYLHKPDWKILRGWWERILWWAGVIAGPPVAGAIGGLLLWKTGLLLRNWGSPPFEAKGLWHVLGMGTPLVTLVLLFVSVLQIGLLGMAFVDHRREWWGRTAAWVLIVCLAWAAVFAIAGYSPLLVLWLRKFPWPAILAGLTWAATTLIGILGARSSKSGDINTRKWQEKLLGATPYVFILGLLILVASGLQSYLVPIETLRPSVPREQLVVRLSDSQAPEKQIQFQIQGKEESGNTPAVPWKEYWQAMDSLSSNKRVWAMFAFVICIGGAFILASRVDLTEFSMHYFYRNRLVRCYLGASHRERAPNPFTGFDVTDDLFLARLVSQKGYDGPYPILGCALNLVHGKDLAWQERKATSFVMTPLHCGYDTWFDKRPSPAQREAKNLEFAYRPTGDYAYPGGFFLGTAMAISGAAASPNMGFHTSPALSFLMTIFNVRIGRWVGNPRKSSSWRKHGPAAGLAYLLAELFGATDDNRGYVYLSDGGHFENLGLYELVKRRCRFIIASDAAEDKDMKFADLASAIRKCRSDMGIDIKIRTNRIFCDEKTRYSLWHCAVGEIIYKNSDLGQGIQNGILVYLKASLSGDEPADVLNYKTVHPDFPHQPTTDLWFNESQFESYRALGQHIIRTIFDDVKDIFAGDLSAANAEELFASLREKWRNPEHIETSRDATTKAEGPDGSGPSCGREAALFAAGSSQAKS